MLEEQLRGYSEELHHKSDQAITGAIYIIKVSRASQVVGDGSAARHVPRAATVADAMGALVSQV